MNKPKDLLFFNVLLVFFVGFGFLLGWFAAKVNTEPEQTKAEYVHTYEFCREGFEQ